VKDIDSITLEDAIELLQYPKILGKHPDDDLPVLVTHSKSGFRIRHRRTLAPLPKVRVLILYYLLNVGTTHTIMILREYKRAMFSSFVLALLFSAILQLNKTFNC
jgi:topoisomerase IA-like protein